MTETEFKSHDHLTELDNLVAIQEDYLEQITKLWTNFVKLAIPKRTVRVIRSRLESLQKLQDICFVQHNRLFTLSDKKIRTELHYFSARTFDTITAKVDEIRDSLNDALSQALEQERGAEMATSLSAVSEAQASVARGTRGNHIDLTPIHISKFSGDYDAWVEFRDIFLSLVDARKNLSDSQKFHYLKSSLDGHAARILRQLKVTEANYKAAWALLTKRYENPRAILYSYLDALIAIPKIGVNRNRDLLNLRDTAYDIYNNIVGLSRPIKLWEDQFIHFILTKLDEQTRHAWELTLPTGEVFPSFEELDAFLSHQLEALRTSGIKDPGPEKRVVPRLGKPNGIRAHSCSTFRPTCFVCSGDHPLFQCAKFLEHTADQRINLLKEQDRCLNCFRRGHSSLSCNNKNTCRICRRKHNTLVHVDNVRIEGRHRSAQTSMGANNTLEAGPSSGCRAGTLSSNLVSLNSNTGNTILPTATVQLESSHGRSVIVRALLDQGSQASFISEAICQLLKPERKQVSVTVSGIGTKAAGIAKGAAIFTVKPCGIPGEATIMRALILPKLTNYIPPPVYVSDCLPYLNQITLADSSQNPSEPIQLIIGADYYPDFLRDGVLRGPPGNPVAQFTAFGWVLTGPSRADTNLPPRIHATVALCNDELSDSLTRFWDLEEVPQRSFPTEKEIAAETHFVETHNRLPNGRYCVHLPFDGTPSPLLKESRLITREMYCRQEVRLQSSPQLKVEYDHFLSEYLRMGHMEEVPANEDATIAKCYLPHHPVINNSSTTTKVRVVFNASFKVRGRTSLNDYLLVGPKLQLDLFALILQWRSYPFVICTDIEKMFRQILVTNADCDFQRIWWRPHSQSELKDYRLLTVTYGTSCAPFLANRVLRQLAQDERAQFPEAANILENNVYVDDVMFGADDPHTLCSLRRQLTQLLMVGGFTCHKWTSNYPESLSEDVQQCSADVKSIGEIDSAKILGIRWNPKSDTFHFQVDALPLARTKREFLSIMSRLFDPLGWVSPAIIVSKIILQTLWVRKVAWDDPLPEDVAKECSNFQQEIVHLRSLEIPRWTGQASGVRHMELHGFSDASNAAYAACIYLKVRSHEGVPTVTLLYSKTKVAPLSLPSVPRLELCAATLLVRSLKFVLESMRLTNIPITCWTDSTVVLAWLRSHPAKWKVFVANRVSEIQSSIPEAQWRHVPTAHNPADCASRGITPSQLLVHPLWWTGPQWLLQEPDEWPNEEPIVTLSAQMEPRLTSSMQGTVTNNLELLEQISSWPKLLRIVAYVLRFVNKSRRRINCNLSESLALAGSEVRRASLYVCKLVQRAYFHHVIAFLDGHRTYKLEKGLQALGIFRDEDGILRVGGRLRNSFLPYNSKFPILLPDCHVSRILILHFHRTSLHGGLQVTLQLLRQSYWVLRARSLVKHCIRNCVTCVRHRASLGSQYMGNLPAPRVTPSRPFTHTGLDYCGPFPLRTSKLRRYKTVKGYCIIFICLSVRAIHLECVSDYTSQGFIAAFNRFIARRGMPSDVYSDNGTNFVGAERELSANLVSLLRDPDLVNRFATDGLDWHFIPPAAPHFGGLWEAGVKSIKHHLRRVLGNFTPTYEEFCTLLCQIESILNSRPLTPLHDDVDSLEVLTPGHFLTGTALSAIPSPSVLDVNEHRLSRWQTIQRLQEGFWKIWSNDYLNTLRQRTKWCEKTPNLEEGDLVLVRHPNLPPTKWELGRVTKSIPGSDGCVRVVQIRTAHSVYKRPVTQLCRLPVDSRARNAYAVL